MPEMFTSSKMVFYIVHLVANLLLFEQLICINTLLVCFIIISQPCDQQSAESERQIPSFMEWGICNVLPGKGYHTLQEAVMK
jgi:hypothetical protein